MYHRSYNEGFIALFTVIIVSFVLLLVAITLNFSGFYGRFNILDSELKEMSDKLADACLEQARLAIAVDDYDLGDEVTLSSDDGECKYTIASGGNITIEAVVKDRAYTYYHVEVDTSDPLVPIVSGGFSECTSVSTCP